MAQQFLQKLQRRSVIEHLRTNPPTTAPGRSDDHRDAIPEPYGTSSGLPRGLSLQILLQGYMLHSGIDAFRSQTGAGFVWTRRRKWRDVIEVSVIFIIRQDKNGLF